MNRDKLRLYSRMDIGIACLLFLFTALYIGTAHADLDVNDVVSGVDAMSGYIDKHHVDELTRTGPRTPYIILAKNEEREERKREQRKREQRKREQEHDNEDDDLAENEEREESKKKKEKEHEDDDEVPTTSTERTATDNIIALQDRSSPEWTWNWRL